MISGGAPSGDRHAGEESRGWRFPSAMLVG
jgi:hypothetical protein